MDGAMLGAFVLLYTLLIDCSLSKVPSLVSVSVTQPTHPLPCFVSCVCNSYGQIRCTDDLIFRLKVEEFNSFLLNTSEGVRSRVQIQTVTAELPDFLLVMPAVHFLSLAENSISIVQNGVLKGMRLRELNLSRNAIQTIQPEAFQDLRYLQMLDLSHNQLTLVSKLAFSDLPYLEVLNLDSNQLQYFPFDAFSQVPRLQVLMLNNNKLSYLLPGSLLSLPAVRILGLRNNSLWSFVVDAMDEMGNLTVLDISGNPFHCSCGFGGLKKLINSSAVTLMESSKTACATPLSLRDRLVEDVIFGLHDCVEPRSVLPYDSQHVLYTTDAELSCDIQGDPDPAVLWVTSWGDQFADSSHWSRLEAICTSCKQQRQYTGMGVRLVSEVSVHSGGKSLHISNFRGYFGGNVTCHAYNYLGNDTAVRYVQVYTAVQSCVRKSMVMGGFCAAGFLCFGLIIGSVKLMVLACMRRFGKEKNVLATPTTMVVSHSDDFQSLTEDTPCKEDSEDFSDAFYPPETPFTTPTAVSPSISPRKIHTPDDGEDTPPGGWLPSNILETMEEVRWRLRYGVGRKMETVKRNVQSIKATGRRNVQSIKESSSVYVHNIMETGSTAANKVKAGVVLGMETVKYHVQSIKEFCGTGDMGAQTISMISVETNLDTNETTEVVKSVTIV